jgi:hypothetical protein
VWQLRSCSCGAPSLTRGQVCLLYVLLALASAVFLGSESLGTWDHILQSHCNFKSHMMSSFHSLTYFLPLFCNYQFWRLNSTQFNSIPLLPDSYPGRMASRNSTLILILWTLLHYYFAWTTQKTQRLYWCKGVFTAPLHNNGSFSIFACVFVAAGICLPSRCLTTNVYSNFTILAFGRHVTILKRVTNSITSEYPKDQDGLEIMIVGVVKYMYRPLRI